MSSTCATATASQEADVESSDSEINFGGNVDDFEAIFAHCYTAEVLSKGLDDEPKVNQKEDKAKNKTKTKAPEVKKKRGRPTRKATTRNRSKKSRTSSESEIELNSSQEADDDDDVELISSNVKKINDEFNQFMASIAGPSKRSPAKAKGKAKPPVLVVPSHPDSDTDECEIVEDDIDVPEPEFESLNVRVRWKGQIYKYRLLSTDKISKLRYMMAPVINMDPAKLMFLLDDEALEDCKSLKECGVSHGVVLEAIRIVPGSGTSKVQRKLERNPDMIRLKFLYGSSQKEQTTMEVNKVTEFSELQNLYAIKMNMDPTKVMFRFDGDIVDDSETPESLELDDDDCLDVVISK